MLFGTEILTTAQMRAIESAAMDSGELPGLTLMERAGAAVAGHIRLQWPKPGHATILCGPGNNGGDGYVIARLLAKAGWRLRVLGLDNIPGPDASEAKRRWRETGPILPLTPATLRGSPANSIHVDAIFGTGLSRPPQDEITALLRHLSHLTRHENTPLVAVDCPSGLCMDSGRWLGGDTDPSFPLAATFTIGFDSPKPGHLLASGPAACGRLIIADIGLRPWRERRTRQADLCAIWPRFPVHDRRAEPIRSVIPRMLGKGVAAGQPQDAHKYRYGHALIVAGAAGQDGAARLAARAAIRSGAGLVTLGLPGDITGRGRQGPDALMLRNIGNAEALQNLLTDRRITALCLGPGCGLRRATDLLPTAMNARLPCVLDADALSALAQNPDWVGQLPDHCVLTPHEGEFSRLFPDISRRMKKPARHGPAYSRIDAVREAASYCNAVVLLKGPDTVIGAPDGRVWVHSAFDIPWLATAGSGDVLAGLITGLLARDLPALEAAAIGCLLHAYAARLFGPGLIADDLPELLPRVYREFGL
ncbi:NAD(P)H-hydrate dehydratase [Paracoccus onubensis]|uniref:NAD(P)H-hydrate dehydratase n=1 Tax=Paracoccus onubensis TaxID=1675788 RepID=UPI00272FB0CE|nr:NAD(P)H-hydrate dehydratase [Paracoccus onubensis]MDP0927278.1 NAD(P)H-hydrate dehydratase [Paracoccus onubensis]